MNMKWSAVFFDWGYFLRDLLINWLWKMGGTWKFRESYFWGHLLNIFLLTACEKYSLQVTIFIEYPVLGMFSIFSNIGGSLHFSGGLWYEFISQGTKILVAQWNLNALNNPNHNFLFEFHRTWEGIPNQLQLNLLWKIQSKQKTWNWRR